MIKKAIRMKLHPGYEAEYEKRHRELWPELKEQLIAHGAKSYQIFLDPETLALFGYLEIEDETRWQQLAATEINQKWWHYMAELMETNPDDSPVTQELKEVFTLYARQNAHSLKRTRSHQLFDINHWLAKEVVRSHS